MIIEFEKVELDEGSSFRLLHQKVTGDKYSWQYHFHPEYEIVCVLGGSGKRHVGNHYSTYNDGDLVLIGPNLPHSGFGLNARGFHEEIVLQFREAVIHESITKLPEMAAIRTLTEMSKHGISFAGETKHIITQKLLNFNQLSPFDRFIELTHILNLMATSEESKLLNPKVTISSNQNQHHIRMQKIFVFVEHNFHTNIDLKEIASLINLSVPSFCNYFKKVMSITFTDFVNQYRIQYACMLLFQDKSIVEICFECGFNNVTYFNKVFKDILKKTPSEFRKIEKNPSITY